MTGRCAIFARPNGSAHVITLRLNGDLDDFTAFVVTANETDAMRLRWVSAIRAAMRLRQRERMMGAAFAFAGAGYSVFRERHRRFPLLPAIDVAIQT